MRSSDKVEGFRRAGVILAGALVVAAWFGGKWLLKNHGYEAANVPDRSHMTAFGAPIPNPNAARYHPGAGVHPIAVVNPYGRQIQCEYAWRMIEPEWCARSIDELELIAVFRGREIVHTGTESYGRPGSDVADFEADIYSKADHVDLIEAKTGKLIASKRLVGSRPRPGRARPGDSFTGEAPEWHDWLRGYVAPSE